ncbi:4Fe-4S binding protein [Labilibaculum euxinus]
MSGNCSAECADACPMDAISLSASGNFLIVNSDKCVGCEACEEVCPEGAILILEC